MKPIFGVKEAEKEYQARYAAYVIISNDKNEIALVQAPNGAYFLPGGEIEGNETKEEAIDREMLEELGFRITLADYLGEACEYFYSRHRDTYFYNPGYFFVAGDWQKVGEPLEVGSRSIWVVPEKGIELLKRGSHQWAVKEWLTK
ncbi:NUDIX hydrolase [Enterococcus pallens]|uniref:MutT/nudix family protein n=1 Tax=Enterococcus pallens ATCC BAA-351 TaxID=1158607 RepID=R2T7L6_9ENTE|nr:NUDIX hydrolase [Enterococcus pallens]EOH96254.1 MutT/nudix family protein [Enterococcus pallens ATCC BAA-351]EOU14533.1 MutT/nudix family protein [Enterococcus pallens ATCC BAA-351]OJG80976.1 MutT/nudix family protein [Enterococcus pallens]